MQISSGEIPDAFIDKYHITPRENNIIAIMAKGLSNKEIAYELGITAMTVKNHIYNIYQKAGAKSKVELLILMNNYDHNSISKIISILS
jgi:DNA-binding CsgD family transcriptional regulator